MQHTVLVTLFALVASLLLPTLAMAGSTGSQLPYQVGAGAPRSNGDFLSNGGGLGTFQAYFIEVPSPAPPSLVVDLFDADVNDGGGTDQDITNGGTADTSVTYTLLDPSGTSMATLTCSPGTCVARDNAWSNLGTIANPVVGHWQLRADTSGTAGDDSNAYGVRAHDGDSSPAGLELNVYGLSYVGPGAADPAVDVFESHDYHPWVTAGCTLASNDFDYDSGLTTTSSIAFSSRSGAFTQTIADANMSGNDVWISNSVGPWTTDNDATDYGIFSATYGVETVPQGGAGSRVNYGVAYLGRFDAAAPAPSAQPEANTFRLYIPNDGGTAPLKPYVGQGLAHVNGPNPPQVGMTTTVLVAVEVTNPTPFPITFSAANVVTANVPGGAVTYVGLTANVTSGTVLTQPGNGMGGDITWNPGTVAAASSEILFYLVNVTPAGPGRVPVTGTPASNGTTAVYTDETTTRVDTFGPLCELAADTNGTLPPGAIGVAKNMTAVGTNPYTVTIDYFFENFSPTDAALNLSALDDLVAVFGATPANWTFTSIAKISGPATFNQDPTYTGQGANTQLIAIGSSLAPSETAQLQVVISVTTPGTYTNQVTFTGQGPGGVPLMDTSTDGTDPDGTDGDNNPDEDDPTVVGFETPVIGTAKNMTATGTGPFTVTIDYVFENFGDVTLSNLTAPDDLVAVFGATPANWTFTSISSGGPGTFAHNAAFNGQGANTELINAGSSLAPGEVGTVQVTIQLITPGTYTNQVTVTGTSPAGTMVNDNSVDGTDPDGTDNDGDPDEDNPTVINVETPVIGAAKAMMATGTNPYTVTIDYAFENFGSVTLSNLTAPDDLVAVFGATPGDWTFTSITTTGGPGTFAANAGFTGQGANTELINPGSSLGVGEVGMIQVVISVTTPGTYTNQVTVTGTSPTGGMVSDTSTDGTDPDGTDGDNNPDEGEPSTVGFETPSIGTAKQMTATGSNPYTVTIDYAFENFGDVTLSSLTALDDLVAVFGATPADWTFTSIATTGGPATFAANAGFTGQGANTELINAGSSLAPGEVGMVQVVISVTTPGSYTNQVTVTGTSPAGMMVSDDSTDGTDPDGTDGDNNPDEDDPSMVDFETPVIGTAKDMSATGTGPYTVTIDYVFENFGDVTLSNLTAPDDLVSVFGATPANWTFTSISSGGPGTFASNAAFTGQGANTELINSGSSLAPGEVGVVQVIIELITPGTYLNQVTVTGDSPNGMMVSDDSTDGTDPDGTDGDNNPDEDDPTELQLGEDPVIGAAKEMTATGTNPVTVTIDYAFENFGNVTLTNLTAPDDLEAVFGPEGANWTFTGITTTGGPGTFAANAAFTGVAPNAELINPGSSLLPGEVGQVQVVIELTAVGTFVNQVTVTGDSPSGMMVSDDSAAGTDPDPDADDDPMEDEPTVITVGDVTTIPTLGEMTLVLFALLLALAAMVTVRRRQALFE